MKRAIRLGDPHSHGGSVVQVGATQTDIMGKPLARKGDKCACPLPGHSAGCTIIEGDPDWTIDGVPVALEGHKTSCGATLISTLPNLTRG
jgi:uncharacterized Zn-binding protein involved in type VI secretion